MFHTKKLAGLLVVFMVACTGGQIQDGVIDYRITPNYSVIRNKKSATGNLAKLEEKYLHIKERDVYIEPGESLSIHLQQAFLNELSGEVAVIARVYESEGRNGELFKSIDRTGRLVHFSPGVKSDGQYLNFSSLPIYGPITYNGRPMILDVFLLEMDDVKSKNHRRLLNFLSRAGGMPHAPSSPVLKMLDAAGETLLDNPDGDRLLKFRMVLYPEIQDNLLNASRLRVGNYVFVRQEDEEDKVPWQNLRLNKVTGRLVNGSNQNWKDKSYLIVHLNKGFNSAELDAAHLYGEILDSLDEETINNQGKISNLMNRLQQGLRDIRARNSDRSKHSFSVRQ